METTLIHTYSYAFLEHTKGQELQKGRNEASVSVQDEVTQSKSSPKLQIELDDTPLERNGDTTDDDFFKFPSFPDWDAIGSTPGNTQYM